MKTNNLNYVKCLLLILISIFIISCSNNSGAIDTDPPIIDNPPDTPPAFNETEDGTSLQKPRVRIVLLKTSDVEITQDKIDRDNNKTSQGNTVDNWKTMPNVFIEDWDSEYYRNVTEEDVRKCVDIDSIFLEYEFTVDTNHCDLFFWGVKR